MKFHTYAGFKLQNEYFTLAINRQVHEKRDFLRRGKLFSIFTILHFNNNNCKDVSVIIITLSLNNIHNILYRFPILPLTFQGFTKCYRKCFFFQSK